MRNNTEVSNVVQHLIDDTEDNVAMTLLLALRASIVNYNDHVHVDVNCCLVRGYYVFFILVHSLLFYYYCIIIFCITLF